MKTVLKNARILKMDGTPLFISNIVIEDSKIVYIGDDFNKFAPFDLQKDINGNVIMPGFKNAHGHSGMSFLRSKADNYKLQDWLFNVVFPREELLTPKRIYDLSKVSYLEYLSSGITASLEQYYFRQAQADASNDIGIRTVLLGTYNIGEGTIEDTIALGKSINDNKDSLVTHFIGIHAEYTSSEEQVKENLKIIEALNVPFFAHISETENETENCLKQRGLTPTEFFNKYSMFKNGGGGFHCIYLSDNDMKLFKDNNLTIVTCPGSNLKLASGICPVKKYLDYGINVAIGTDGPASNNSLDMFKEMHLVNYLSKLETNNAVSIDAYTILKMATVNGAKAMKLEDCDILEVGKKADLIEIDLSKPSMQPLNNIVDNIVYSGSKDIVKMTMIDGKILYEDGKFHLKENVDDIYKAAQKATDEIEQELRN